MPARAVLASSLACSCNMASKPYTSTPTKKTMNYIKYLIPVILTCTAIGCTEGFKAINTNPNAPVEIQPGLLLRQVIYDYGDEMAYEGFVAGNPLGQYFTMVDFNLFDRHSLTEPQFGGNPWPTMYRNLRDNEIILQSARSKPAQAIYEGPALVLKAYISAALTDIYGDVPYRQALQGAEGIVTPAYDPQEQIYTGEEGILDNLETAIGLMENYSGVSSLEGDLLFGGDLQGWIRLANSLRIKALMRISDRVEVKDQLQAIYDSGNFITLNEENAAFDFAVSQPNNFRMANLRAGDFNLYVMSETIEEILKGLQDPRIAVFFRPADSAPAGDPYSGLLNGQDASNISISVSDYSLTGRIFREEPGGLDANFMTAWEVHFWLAEAAERGLISAEAQPLYEEGVRLAFEYWQTQMPAGYLTEGPAAYGTAGSNKIEQIITQKWLAHMINGYEGWIEYRRTGFPRFKPIAASLNEGRIPVRMPYPISEAALNQDNFDAATAENGNSANQRVWWDVE